MEKSELLRVEHQAQLTWLNNQMAKVETVGDIVFLNVEAAKRAYNKMNKSLIAKKYEIEHFVSVHLSAMGIKKLVITLRSHIKRNGRDRLQIELTKNNKAKLDDLVKISGRTKIEIINLLISDANLSKFKNKKTNRDIKS